MYMLLSWNSRPSKPNELLSLFKQNRLLDSVGEGESGMFWENSMYIIYNETDHQPRWDAWDKCSGLVH